MSEKAGDAPTTSNQRLAHDELVLKEAVALLAQGFAVKARLEGLFEPPEVISGYRPDIVAIHGGDRIIIEVKKGEVDWPKLAAFEQYASQHPGLTLRIVDLDLATK